jgi:copper chaperone CopZ
VAVEYRKKSVEEMRNRSQICMHNGIQCESNAATITEQLTVLEGKLQHEQQKLVKYDDELKGAEVRTHHTVLVFQVVSGCTPVYTCRS